MRRLPPREDDTCTFFPFQPFSLPFLEIFKALSAFNRRNIIIFLKKFKLICDNVSFKIKIKIKRILKYYDDDVARKMKRYNI